MRYLTGFEHHASERDRQILVRLEAFEKEHGQI